MKNTANLACITLPYKAVLHRSKILACNPFIRDCFVFVSMPFSDFFFLFFCFKRYFSRAIELQEWSTVEDVLQMTLEMFLKKI